MTSQTAAHPSVTSDLQKSSSLTISLSSDKTRSQPRVSHRNQARCPPISPEDQLSPSFHLVAVPRQTRDCLSTCTIPTYGSAHSSSRSCFYHSHMRSTNATTGSQLVLISAIHCKFPILVTPGSRSSFGLNACAGHWLATLMSNHPKIALPHFHLHPSSHVLACARGYG